MSARSKKKTAKFLWIILIIPLLVGGFITQKNGYQKVREMRQLERIPETDVIAVIPGEISMRGSATDWKSTENTNEEISLSRLIEEQEANKLSGMGWTFVTGPYSNKECFYCYYKKEKRETNSDGEETWKTVESGTRHVKYLKIKDSTGDILVSLESLIRTAKKRPNLGKDYYQRRGNYRWTERRIDLNEEIFVFAMAIKTKKGFEINFAKQGSYSPILTDGNEVSSRAKQGGIGVLLTFSSLVCFSFGILLFCFVIRIHRILNFLGILASLNVIVLTTMGIDMMESDVKDGNKRLKRHEANANVEISNILKKPFKWESVHQLAEAINNEKYKNRVIGIRNDYAAAIERNNAILDRFPEKYLSGIWKVSKQKSIFKPNENQPSDSKIIKSPLPTWLTLLGGITALLVGIIATKTGFKIIKTKRYIENIPTSFSKGLAYGPAEIMGSTVLYEGNEHRIIGPLSKKECVYYRYLVTEKRGSGKDEKTVVIEDRIEMVPFLCKDEEGYTRVFPVGANFMCDDTKEHRKSGRRTYKEWNITENQQIYLLGSAVIEPIEGETLQMADGENDGFPFLISDQSETETMLSVSRSGLLWISCGFIGIVTLVLLCFASTGSYSPSDFLLSSLTAPAFLLLSTFILMFNDLVFLKNRVKRAHSNIEVSLQKRSELIPDLEHAVKSYFKHEKDIHQKIVDLRTKIIQKKQFSTKEIDTLMKAENEITNQLFALSEKYPEIKGQEVLGKLMENLRFVENEVALMRQGYNDSVEIYKTTSQRLPEIFIAKLFNFKPVDYLKTKLSVRKKPDFNFN